MKFTIIGAGAIGGVVGGYLAHHGNHVTLVDKLSDFKHIRKRKVEFGEIWPSIKEKRKCLSSWNQSLKKVNNLR